MLSIEPHTIGAALAARASSGEPLSPGVGGGTALDERVDDGLGDGDHERFAHYVNKVDMTRSAVTGEPVIALCGKKWVPNRDPQRFPVCPECKKIYEALKAAGR